jgi:hypothetical protein
VSFFLFYSVCSSCSPLFGDSPEVACCKTLFFNEKRVLEVFKKNHALRPFTGANWHYTGLAALFRQEEIHVFTDRENPHPVAGWAGTGASIGPSV